MSDLGDTLPGMASIEERPHRTGTTWRVVWWEPGRKRQQLTFTDPAKAARFKQLVEGSGNQWPAGWDRPSKAGPRARAGALTFDAWARRSIANRSRANERTKVDYIRDLERHFESLRPLPLIEIGDDDVTAWIAGREEVGLAPKTIRNLHGFASSIMEDAQRQHPPLVARNPFDQGLGASASVHTEEMTFLTHQEFDLVWRYVRCEYQPLIRFLVGTGLRFGESTALLVRDVDLLGDRKTVTVTKAWKRTGPSTYVVGEPKTPRSRRTLSLSGELVELLTPLWAGRRGDELLFAGGHGLRLPHSEVYKRGWAPAVARARVCDAHYEPQRDGRRKRPRLPAPCDCAGVLQKTPRIHDLRHTWVSWMIAEGIDLSTISRRAGHSSITITNDRYGHMDPSKDELVNAAIDRALARR